MYPEFIPEYDWLTNECRQKPTDVEKHLIDLLRKELDDDYTVFYHPHYDTPSSEVAVMNTNGGVLLILINEDEKRSLPSDDRIFISADKHKWKLHNASIRMLLKKNKNCDFIKCAVYFGKIQFKDIESHYKALDSNHLYYCHSKGDKQRPLIRFWGMDDETSLINGIKECLRPNKTFTQEMMLECKRILGPSFSYKEENSKTYVSRADSNRAKYAISVRGQKQQIIGEAGSGKTLLLAKRSLECYLRTRHENTISPIYIFTYNITLRNYIYSQLASLAITELEETTAWELEENIRVIHFDKFLKDVLESRNIQTYDQQVDDYNTLREEWMEKIYILNKEKAFKSFSALLIDEAQDYKEKWIRLLTDIFVNENTEMLVVFDEKQDVYGNHEDKQDKRPRIPKVKNKKPARIEGSYRLSKILTHLADNYQRFFWKEKYNDIGIKYMPSKVKQTQWSLLDQFSHLENFYFDCDFDPKRIINTIDILIKRYEIHYGDIAFLALNDNELRGIYDVLIDKWGIQPQMMCLTNDEMASLEGLHLCESDKNRTIKSIERIKKYDFKIRSDLPKVCTIKSFKGWEIATVILIITPKDSNDTCEEQIYTGITRAMQNLIILNFGNKHYEEFFLKKYQNSKRNIIFMSYYQTKTLRKFMK